ncbi:MAG TPA: CrcB family protein [Acidiferrobacter sp.]|nr:CrcB family protein [Acidiferrobacter sp.]
MWTLISIGVFAVLGAWARYGQSLLVQGVLGRAFPWATLSVNVLGSFLMGFLFFETVDRITMDPILRTGILTGGLGAYTTFSTFALENLVLIQEGEALKATLYVVASNVLGIGAALGGAWLSRNI